ncbi:MAG: DNA cytosine methyltransferase [Alphaproteobacteria bacterium]|nr:DNA cytosine methyltransferase [Alphaproteobacteria bacterium]
MLSKFKIGELFAGIGGIGLGFEKAGFNVVWANEIDQKACHTYMQNFKCKVYCQDMKTIDPSKLDKIDILTGGFPCQPYSIAGYQKGFSDERGGNIFYDIIRYIKILKPRVVFLENVKNLLSHDKGNTFKIILNALEDEGYSIKYKVMKTSEYSDVPQARERVYIVCFKKKSDYNRFEFPKIIKKHKPISEFLDENADKIFYYKESSLYPELKKNITKTDTIYQWRRHYVRENKSNLCPTMTANMGMGGHNVPLIKDSKDIRKLTPRECARFQGYPDNFILPSDLTNSALYKQIGNSVSVPVITAIAKNIKKALEGEE